MDLQKDLTDIQTVNDKLVTESNQVARFSYTDKAYTDNLVDGVSEYNFEAEQNIPISTAGNLTVSEQFLDKGVRAQSSSIPRMFLNGMLGRASYNLNKAQDFLKVLLATVKRSITRDFGLYSPTAQYQYLDCCYMNYSDGATVPELTEPVTLLFKRISSGVTYLVGSPPVKSDGTLDLVNWSVVSTSKKVEVAVTQILAFNEGTCVLSGGVTYFAITNGLWPGQTVKVINKSSSISPGIKVVTGENIDGTLDLEVGQSGILEFDGTIWKVRTSYDEKPSTIALRTSQGTLRCASPVYNSDTVNLKYLNDTRNIKTYTDFSQIGIDVTDPDVTMLDIYKAIPPNSQFCTTIVDSMAFDSIFPSVYGTFIGQRDGNYCGFIYYNGLSRGDIWTAMGTDSASVSQWFKQATTAYADAVANEARLNPVKGDAIELQSAEGALSYIDFGYDGNAGTDYRARLIVNGNDDKLIYAKRSGAFSEIATVNDTANAVVQANAYTDSKLGSVVISESWEQDGNGYKVYSDGTYEQWGQYLTGISPSFQGFTLNLYKPLLSTYTAGFGMLSRVSDTSRYTTPLVIDRDTRGESACFVRVGNSSNGTQATWNITTNDISITYNLKGKLK